VRSSVPDDSDGAGPVPPLAEEGLLFVESSCESRWRG
jgi:hypothetical protein